MHLCRRHKMKSCFFPLCSYRHLLFKYNHFYIFCTSNCPTFSLLTDSCLNIGISGTWMVIRFLSVSRFPADCNPPGSGSRICNPAERSALNRSRNNFACKGIVIIFVCEQTTITDNDVKREYLRAWKPLAAIIKL